MKMRTTVHTKQQVLMKRSSPCCIRLPRRSNNLHHHAAQDACGRQGAGHHSNGAVCHFGIGDQSRPMERRVSRTSLHSPDGGGGWADPHFESSGFSPQGQPPFFFVGSLTACPRQMVVHRIMFSMLKGTSTEDQKTKSCIVSHVHCAVSPSAQATFHAPAGNLEFAILLPSRPSSLTLTLQSISSAEKSINLLPTRPQIPDMDLRIITLQRAAAKCPWQQSQHSKARHSKVRRKETRSEHSPTSDMWPDSTVLSNQPSPLRTRTASPPSKPPEPSG